MEDSAFNGKGGRKKKRKSSVRMREKRKDWDWAAKVRWNFMERESLMW